MPRLLSDIFVGANTSEDGELFTSEDMGAPGKERQKHFRMRHDEDKCMKYPCNKESGLSEP